MATEYQLGSYYDKKHFIDTHFLSKLAISSYLASVGFKSDLSRIIYAPLEMTFRRRMETVDKENGIQEGIFQPKDLQLPYASFYQESDWEDDDRAFTKQAYKIVHGFYLEELSMRLPARAVKSKYKVTMFFNREDDRRIAHQLWSFEKGMNVPIFLKIPVNYKNKKIDIPVNLTIDTISTTKEYKEQEHLEKARILPMSLDFTVRSYQILIPYIQEHTPLPYKFAGEKLKYWFKDDYKPRIATSATLKVAASKLYETTQWQEPSLKGIVPDRIDDDIVIDVNKSLIYDICKGFFTDPIPLGFKTFFFEDIQSDKVTFKYDLLDGTHQALERIDIMFPSLKPITITDFSKKELVIEGLYANSEYHVVIIVYLKNNESKTYTLNVTTLNDKNNKSPTTSNKKYGKLIGKQF